MCPVVYYIIIRAYVLNRKATLEPVVKHIEAQYQTHYIIEPWVSEADYIINYYK